MAGRHRRPSEAIAAAVRRGALSAARAEHWLAYAADHPGEDMSFIDGLWGPGQPVRAGSPALVPDDGMTAQERADYEAMFPPGGAAEAAARIDAAAAEQRSLAEAYTDRELFESIFGPGTYGA